MIAWFASVAAAGIAIALALYLVLRHLRAMRAEGLTNPSPREVARLARRDGVSLDAVRTRLAVAARRRAG